MLPARHQSRRIRIVCLDSSRKYILGRVERRIAIFGKLTDIPLKDVSSVPVFLKVVFTYLTLNVAKLIAKGPANAYTR